jgi:hypothetical protein
MGRYNDIGGFCFKRRITSKTLVLHMVVGTLPNVVVLVLALIGFLVRRRKTDSGDTQISELTGVIYSFTEGNAGNDSLLGPSSVLVTHPLFPAPVLPASVSVSAT